MRKVINISVSERLYKEVEEAVRQNKYETKSELFRDLLRAWKEGRFGAPAGKFRADTLLKNAQKHAAKGGPSDLSQKHDHYLYGE